MAVAASVATLLSLSVRISASVSYTHLGYKKLMAELKHLETVARPKISAAIAEARDKGDLSDVYKRQLHGGQYWLERAFAVDALIYGCFGVHHYIGAVSYTHLDVYKRQGGNSVADVLSGKASPSGKLTMTFPVKFEDAASSDNFPIDMRVRCV